MQDACLLGRPNAVEWFEGKPVASAVIGGRTVWAVAENDEEYTSSQVKEELAFLGVTEHIEMFE